METDQDLLARCRVGDTAAFDALVRRWQAPVARLVARLAGGGGDAAGSPGGPRDGADLRGDVEDLAQEVFLRVLRGSESWEGRSAVSTWIYRIAINVTRDAARRRRAWWRRTRRQARRSAEPSAGEDASRREGARLVSAALAGLPARLREPLVLRHYGDLTFREAAEVLGVPVGTVKSRVKTGLLRLREELKRRGFDEQELES